MLLAIDPGADSGWAIFFGGMLVSCGLGQEPNPAPKTGFPLVVIEHPVIYPGGKTRNPNDVLKCAVSAGEWAGRYRRDGGEIRYVLPRDWKGTIDGDTCNRRAIEKLEDHERQVFEDALRTQRFGKKKHNVLDAIGLGLFAIGRFKS